MTCHAYCLMYTHYHLSSRPNGALSKGMARLNGSYAQEYNDEAADSDRTVHVLP